MGARSANGLHGLYLEPGKQDSSPSNHQQGDMPYSFNGPLARYVDIVCSACAGNAGKFSSPPWVSNPGMHHGTCMTHVS